MYLGSDIFRMCNPMCRRERRNYFAIQLCVRIVRNFLVGGARRVWIRIGGEVAHGGGSLSVLEAQYELGLVKPGDPVISVSGARNSLRISSCFV